MLPLPPLDGGRVLTGLLPASLARAFARLERYGLFILVGLIFILPSLGGAVGFRIDPFAWLIGGPARFVTGVIVGVVGLQ
jgi:Zn-dependent protease